MMDDAFNPLRSRQVETARAILRGDADPSETGRALVGRIFAKVSIPTSPGRYFAAHPVTALGAEVEGGPGSLTVDEASTVPVFVLGPGVPREGDDLICHFLGHRWVAEKMTGSRPSTVDLGDCLCDAVPPLLYMSSADTSSDGGMFQDCTLSYGPTPTEFAPLSLGEECFLSDQSFPDAQSGLQFRYYFYCAYSAFNLTRIFIDPADGPPFLDITRYTWQINASGNECTPFLLSRGQVFPGGDPRSGVTISE